MAMIAVGPLLVWAGVIVVAAVVLLIRDDPRPDRRHGACGATITELHVLELLEDRNEIDRWS